MSGKSINFNDKKMSNLTIKERKSKFNKLSNSLNIKLIKVLIKVKTLKQNLLI